MKRGAVVGLAIAVGAVGAAALGVTLRRVLGAGAELPARQWPFDREELGALMGRTIAEQRAIVDRATREDERERARAFLDYYEGRRAAALAGAGHGA